MWACLRTTDITAHVQPKNWMNENAIMTNVHPQSSTNNTVLPADRDNSRSHMCHTHTQREAAVTLVAVQVV